MIEKLKTDATLAYQQLISIGLGKYSRGIVSVISRDTGTIVTKTSTATIVAKLSDDIPELQQHLTIFRTFPTVNAIVQPYAKYSTVFAQIGTDIPMLGTFHEDYFARDIPCIQSLNDLEHTFIGQNIDPHQTSAVLLIHQGAFVWGCTLEEAINNANLLEEVATLAYLSLQIDPGLISYK